MIFLLLTQNSNEFMDYISKPPGSMFFILLISTIVAIIITILNKLFVDTEEIQRKQLIMKAHNEEKAEIIKLAETNPEKYRKERKRWMKKDAMIKKMQQGMALQRLKPSLITMVPLLIMFWILRTYIYGNNPVAAPPMNPWDVPWLGNMIMASTDGVVEWTKEIYGREKAIKPQNGWINFTAWYFICSLGINTLLQRLLGMQTQASGGMESMFKGQKAQAMEWPEV